MPTTQSVQPTPGPWMRDGTIMSDHLEIDLRLDDAGENWVTVKGDRDTVVEANARLIAAAPELLAAARDLHRYITDDEWRRELDERASVASDGNVNAYEMVTDRARAAIAKAEGRAT